MKVPFVGIGCYARSRGFTKNSGEMIIEQRSAYHVYVTPKLVKQFYDHIWNAGNLEAADQLLTDGFIFRGSMGLDLRGIEPFKNYVRSIRSTVAEYHCDIIECVSEGPRAFAKMLFSGKHVGALRGFTATGKYIEWYGAALFRFTDERITELWVLGDLAALDALLQANARTPHA